MTTQTKRSRDTFELVPQLPTAKKEKFFQAQKRSLELVGTETTKRIKIPRGIKRESETLGTSTKKFKPTVEESDVNPFFLLMGLCSEGLYRTDGDHIGETFEYPPLFDYEGCSDMIRLLEKLLCEITKRSKDHSTFKFYISIFKSLLHMFCSYRQSDPWNSEKQRMILNAMRNAFANVRDYSYKQYMETKDEILQEMYPSTRKGTDVIELHQNSLMEVDVY